MLGIDNLAYAADFLSIAFLAVDNVEQRNVLILLLALHLYLAVCNLNGILAIDIVLYGA
jgi:hypothetical protein